MNFDTLATAKYPPADSLESDCNLTRSSLVPLLIATVPLGHLAVLRATLEMECFGMNSSLGYLEEVPLL